MMKNWLKKILITLILCISICDFGYSHCPFCNIPIISLNKDFNSNKIGLNYNHVFFYIFNFGSELQIKKDNVDIGFYGGLGFTPLFQTQYSISLTGKQTLRFRTDLSTMIINEILLNSSIDSKWVEDFCKLNISLYIDKTLGVKKAEYYFGIGIGLIIAE